MKSKQSQRFDETANRQITARLCSPVPLAAVRRWKMMALRGSQWRLAMITWLWGGMVGTSAPVPPHPSSQPASQYSQSSHCSHSLSPVELLTSSEVQKPEQPDNSQDLIVKHSTVFKFMFYVYYTVPYVCCTCTVFLFKQNPVFFSLPNLNNRCDDFSSVCLYVWWVYYFLFSIFTRSFGYMKTFALGIKTKKRKKKI